MENISEDYLFIQEKIHSFKNSNDFLKKKTDDYVFSALCEKSIYYKNPSFDFSRDQIESSIVDGCSDGGIDILLSDPSSENSDLIICQSKFHKNIQYEEVANAISKMITFYLNMENGDYEKYNEHVKSRFLDLRSEQSDESRIKFVFLTSSKRNGIRDKSLQKLLTNSFKDISNFELDIYFGNDIVEEIKEAESRRPSVESGKLKIDKTNNFLLYGENEEAALVNVSAFSLKELYAKNNINLLSRNLRYYIKKRDIDSEINRTIKEDPDSFWYRNNGVTIICDDYKIDGTCLKLNNFSIVNGGQTTYLISKSPEINKGNDFYLVCKIIVATGSDEDDKNDFSLEVAKATNSQKAIKNIDLKSNTPEQVRFNQTMKEIGVFYQTKRGEKIPTEYKISYKNSNLAEIGKLCLAGIFQRPGKSRSNPSMLYKEKYYERVFNSNQKQVANLSKDLLYINHYFNKNFKKRFDKEYENSNIFVFAHNARTLCIAFFSLLSRINYGSITKDDFNVIGKYSKEDGAYEKYFYSIFGNLENQVHFISIDLMLSDFDKLDEYLYKIFIFIIKIGYQAYGYSQAGNETNFLKNDKNYYMLFNTNWDTFYEFANECCEVFEKDK